MFAAMKSLFVRDFKLAVRVGGGAIVGILFFLALTIVIPFGIGPNLNLLAQIGPAILWIGAVLATLLGLDRLFQVDHEDGTLEIIRMSGQPIEIIVLVKCAAHWMVTGIPLILATPVLSLFLNLAPTTVISLMLTLLIGTPVLTLIGCVGAAITVSLKRGGLLNAIIVIPFTIPVLIFGVSSVYSTTTGSTSFLTPIMLLCAISLVMLVVCPFVAGLAIKNSSQ